MHCAHGRDGVCVRQQTGVHVCACVCGVTCAGVCAHVRVCRRQVCAGVRVRGHVCRRVRTCARACQRQVRAGQVCGGRALASLRTSIRATAAHRGLGGGEPDAAGRARWYVSQVRRVPFSLC